MSFWKKEYFPYKDFLGLLIIKIANEKKVINKIVLKIYTPIKAKVDTIKKIDTATPPAKPVAPPIKNKKTKEQGLNPTMKKKKANSKINIDSPLQSIASVLFNQAKKQSSAINSIQIIKEKTEKK